MKSKSPLIAALLGLTASIASADMVRPPIGGDRPPMPPLPDALAKYDTDHDGVLSSAERGAMIIAIRAEMAAKRAEFIAKWDTDGDGVLSADERAAARAAIEAEKAAARLAALTAKFDELDTDGVAGISPAEWAAGAPAGADAARVAAAFARMDADGDGLISLEEFTAGPKHPGQDHGHGRGRGK